VHVKKQTREQTLKPIAFYSARFCLSISTHNISSTNGLHLGWWYDGKKKKKSKKCVKWLSAIIKLQRLQCNPVFCGLTRSKCCSTQTLGRLCIWNNNICPSSSQKWMFSTKEKLYGLLAVFRQNKSMMV